MLTELKEFIARGNVVDLAVGVIMGVAFGAITTSLVNDVIMPVIGLVIGGVDFTNLFVVLSNGTAAVRPATLAEAKAAGAATINYGLFINTILNFLIVAFVVFLIIKAVNRMRRQQAAAPEEPGAPPEDILLLREIRDAVRR